MEKNNLVVLGKFVDQLRTAIKTCPLVYIPHFDVGYIETVLVAERTKLDICNEHGLLKYDNAFGVVDLLTQERLDDRDYEPKLDITLENLLSPVSNEQEDGGHFVIRGTTILLMEYVFEELKNAKTQSLIQNFCMRYAQEQYEPDMTLIIVGEEPDLEDGGIPNVLKQLFTVVELPAPSENEIREYLNCFMSAKNIGISLSDQAESERILADLIRTLQGLQLIEIKQILRSAICLSMGEINHKTIAYALEEKKKFVKKTGIIEVVDTDVTLDQIGGLQNLRQDIRKKQVVFRNLTYALDRRGGQLQLPKGILILGMPGCGKSMIAKSIANAFGVSLLRLDVNRLMGKFVGESELNLRKALKTAEAAHPCVLWIDEIEKAFAGIDSGNNDIIMRLMGHFLTWMQERRTAVYVVATANDTLKPELMRKGRFDEVYYVSFPNESDALEILNKKLEPHRKSEIYDLSDLTDSNLRKIARNMQGNKHGGFSGAEIEFAVGLLAEQAFLRHVELKKNSPNPERVKFLYADMNSIVINMKSTVLSSEADENGPISRIEKLGKAYKPASL